MVEASPSFALDAFIHQMPTLHVTNERIFTTKHLSGIVRPLFIPHTCLSGMIDTVSIRVPLGNQVSISPYDIEMTDWDYFP